MLYRLVHQVSFAIIAATFGLTNSKMASDVFWRHAIHQYNHNCNIPRVIHNQVVNQSEVDKLLEDSYMRTPYFYKVLMRNFEDPRRQNRVPVPINIDGTYIDIEGSDDFQLNKYMFYQPRSGHTAKWLNLTDLSPKFIGMLPIASSQTPSSGDGLLLAKHIELEDSSGAAQYLRSILRGNDEYFVVLITDAGFVCSVPNAPSEARGPSSVTLAEVCRQEHCVLLHTSNKQERYHLERTP